MLNSANSRGQYSNSDSTNEQAAADEIVKLMTGLPTSMLTSNLGLLAGFNGHDLRSIPLVDSSAQLIPAGESAPNQYRTPSVDTIPMDTRTTSRDEMLQRINVAMRKRQFVSWRSMESGMYSSAFVEPLSKEIFLSGHLVNRLSAVHDSGLVWYANKEDAEEAAVARCLDCVELREGSPRPFGRRVEEAPYESGKGLPLPIAIPEDVRSQLGMEIELPREVDTTASGLSGEMSSITPDQDGFSTVTSSNPRSRGTDCHPTSMLTDFYRTEAAYRERAGVVILTKKNFVTWNVGEAHTRKFTGAFVCPVSGEIFLSGRWMLWQKSCSERNGRQWYLTKKKAEAAAAAVAHDCFCFRKELANNNRSGLDVRFCVEPPYREGSQSEEDFIDSIPFEQRAEIQQLQREASHRTL